MLSEKDRVPATLSGDGVQNLCSDSGRLQALTAMSVPAASCLPRAVPAALVRFRALLKLSRESLFSETFRSIANCNENCALLAVVNLPLVCWVSGTQYFPGTARDTGEIKRRMILGASLNAGDYGCRVLFQSGSMTLHGSSLSN